MTETAQKITTVEENRAVQGAAHQMNCDKSINSIDEHIRNFLALSTFLTVASIDSEGRMDVSPKGDPPGFVKVLDNTRPRMGEVMFDHGHYGEKYEATREQVTRMAQEDCADNVY